MMNSFLGFLGMLAVAAAILCAIALMLVSFWEIVKYLIDKTRG